MSPHGLSQKQVEERIAKGLQNTLPPSASKTNGQIFKENICTLFNLLKHFLVRNHHTVDFGLVRLDARN